MKRILSILLLAALTSGCIYRSSSYQKTSELKPILDQSIQPLKIIEPSIGQNFKIGELVNISYQVSTQISSSTTKREVLEIYLADSTGRLYGKIGSVQIHSGTYSWDSAAVTMNGGLDTYQQRPPSGIYSFILVAWTPPSQSDAISDGDAPAFTSLDGITTFKDNQLVVNADNGDMGTKIVSSVFAVAQSATFELH